MGRTRRRGGKSFLSDAFEYITGPEKTPNERAIDELTKKLEATKGVYTAEKENVDKELNNIDSKSKEAALLTKQASLADTVTKIEALIEAFKHIFKLEPENATLSPLPLSPGSDMGGLDNMPVPNLNPNNSVGPVPNLNPNNPGPDLNNMGPGMGGPGAYGDGGPGAYDEGGPGMGGPGAYGDGGPGMGGPGAYDEGGPGAYGDGPGGYGDGAYSDMGPGAYGDRPGRDINNAPPPFSGPNEYGKGGSRRLRSRNKRRSVRKLRR